MKKVNVRFELDEGRDDIDAVFRGSVLDEQVLALMGRIADPLAGALAVYDGEGATTSLPEDSIISVSSDHKKLKVVSDEGVFYLREPLDELEKALNPSEFLRISRYEIINLRKVKRFDFSVSGTLRIEMENGIETWASRRRIHAIRLRLQGKELKHDD